MSNLDKALQTNSSQMPPIDKKCGLNVAEFRDPNFNQATIQKRIDELNKEISDLQHQAFSVYTVKNPELSSMTTISIKSKIHDDIGILTSGVDIEDLQSKIVLRDSLIENLKTEQLRCSCKTKKFTRTVDENSNPLCSGCGKII